MAPSATPHVEMGHDDQEEQHFSYAMQLVTSAVLPIVLETVVQLEVFEIIARAGPGAKISASEIASQLPTTNPRAPHMLDRMLRFLACHSVLTCSISDKGNDVRLYGLAPVAKYFVRDEDGASLGPLIINNQDKVNIDTWDEIKESILEGGVPFVRVHKAYPYEHPSERYNKVFNEGQRNHASLVLKRILECYKGFDNIKTLVDVGGGYGSTLQKITKKYPTIKGINFDLPHVVKNAPVYEGVEHVGGDMFKSVPKGDAMFMKWVIEAFGDDRCIQVLKNCYKSLPENGKVIVVDLIYPEKPECNPSVISNGQMDMILMSRHEAGKTRSEREFRALAKEAGFAGMRLECIAYNCGVMEFYK